MLVPERDSFRHSIDYKSCREHLQVALLHSAELPCPAAQSNVPCNVTEKPSSMSAAAEASVLQGWTQYVLTQSRPCSTISGVVPGLVQAFLLAEPAAVELVACPACQLDRGCCAVSMLHRQHHKALQQTPGQYMSSPLMIIFQQVSVLQHHRTLQLSKEPVKFCEAVKRSDVCVCREPVFAGVISHIPAPNMKLQVKSGDQESPLHESCACKRQSLSACEDGSEHSQL